MDDRFAQMDERFAKMDDRFEALLREAAKDREQAAKDREQIATTLQVLVVLNNQIHRQQKRQMTLLERSLRLQVETNRLLRQLVSGRNGRGHHGNGNGRGRG